MDPVLIVVLCVAAVIALLVVPMLIVTLPIAKKVYNHTLVRTDQEKWGRCCSDTTNEEQVQMWDTGCQWAEKYKNNMKEVSVENEGLKLFGEYYDFGSDKCVIVLPGRCESLMYSYYFAEPYRKAGCNVLVIDARAHGKSDGIYTTVGTKEGSDVREWIRFLENEQNIHKIYFHSLCLGTGAALVVMSQKNAPDSVKGLITEGCYTSFREVYKQHMVDDNRPLFPVLDMVMMKLRIHGAKISTHAPIRLVKRIKQPILFLYSRKDKFSLPEKSVKLFSSCSSEDKKLIWFDEGAHSHIRINNTEKYDNTIGEFLKTH